MSENCVGSWEYRREDRNIRGCFCDVLTWHDVKGDLSTREHLKAGEPVDGFSGKQK